MRKNKCLLFACIEKNIGDDLFVQTICRRYSNTVFVITASARYGSLADIPNLRFSRLLEKWISYSNREPTDRLRRWKRNIFVFLLKCLVGRYQNGVYIVGNAFTNDRYRGAVQSAWIRDRISLTRRFFLISTNFGPYTDERWKNDFDHIFAKMTDVCFRDAASYHLFEQLPNVRCRPDALFSLGRQQRGPGTHKTLLVSLIDCGMTGRPDDVRRQCALYESKMAETVRAHLQNGYDVVFLNANTAQDHDAANRVIALLPAKERVSVFDYDGNIDALLALYRRADRMIATRLHTIVLAFLFHTPVLPIVYDQKVAGVLQSCGYAGLCYQLSGIGAMTPSDVEAALGKDAFTLHDAVIRQSEEQFAVIDRYLK